MKRPMKVGEQYIEADDVGLVVYQVKEVTTEGVAFLEILAMLDYYERIPNCFQGLPLFDSRG